MRKIFFLLLFFSTTVFAGGSDELLSSEVQQDFGTPQLEQKNIQFVRQVQEAIGGSPVEKQIESDEILSADSSERDDAESSASSFDVNSKSESMDVARTRYIQAEENDTLDSVVLELDSSVAIPQTNDLPELKDGDFVWIDEENETIVVAENLPEDIIPDDVRTTEDDAIASKMEEMAIQEQQKSVSQEKEETVSRNKEPLPSLSDQTDMSGQGLSIVHGFLLFLLLLVLFIIFYRTSQSKKEKED